MTTRRYSDVLCLNTFDTRFEYFKLDGSVGRSTFGFDRHINQRFYTSSLWRSVRNEVIIRDCGCDLGIPGFEINGALLVHHVNPINSEEINSGEDWILNPEYLITTTQMTHNALHFGNKNSLPKPIVDRKPNDTKLW